jgi:hypothetical protein
MPLPREYNNRIKLFFNVSYTMNPRFLVDMLQRNSMFCETLSVVYFKDLASGEVYRNVYGLISGPLSFLSA